MINLFVDNDGAVRCGYIGTIVLNDRITIATGVILPSLELQISIHRFIQVIESMILSMIVKTLIGL